MALNEFVRISVDCEDVNYVSMCVVAFLLVSTDIISILIYVADNVNFRCDLQ